MELRTIINGASIVWVFKIIIQLISARHFHGFLRELPVDCRFDFLLIKRQFRNLNFDLIRKCRRSHLFKIFKNLNLNVYNFTLNNKRLFCQQVNFTQPLSNIASHELSSHILKAQWVEIMTNGHSFSDF